MEKNLKGMRERRRFPRVMAPVLWREARQPLEGRRTKRERISNISLGGVRIYSDERLEVGQQLNLEFFLPGGTSIEARARVIWFLELPPGAPGVFDVGLEFLALSKKARKALGSVVK
ncbi:MAG: PilZ domain-containing protein, partial [Candidatus Aminicenantales bacterium]